MLYHPVGVFAEAGAEPGYNIVRSILLVVGGVLAARWDYSCATSSSLNRGLGRADRVTTCSGSTSRRRWWSGCWRRRRRHQEVRHVAIMFVDFRNFTGAARLRSRSRSSTGSTACSRSGRHPGRSWHREQVSGRRSWRCSARRIEDPTRRAAVEAGRECWRRWRRITPAMNAVRIGIGIHMGNVVAAMSVHPGARNTP